MLKSVFLGASTTILSYIICYVIIRSLGIESSISFAAIVLISVSITCLGLIIIAIRKIVKEKDK
jgi:hypothetical protein